MLSMILDRTSLASLTNFILSLPRLAATEGASSNTFSIFPPLGSDEVGDNFKGL